MSCSNKGEKVHTYEGGAVSETDSVLAFRGSDRHGSPRDVKNVPHSVAAMDGFGVGRMTDGSEKNPLSLMLAERSGNRLIVGVADEEGKVSVIGYAEPADDGDWFVVSKGGQITFVRTPTIRNSFPQDSVPPAKSGKLVVLDCGPDNTLVLSTLLPCSKKHFLLIDTDGSPSCAGACDLFDEHDADDGMDSIWGCLSGDLKKITAVEGKQLIVKDGKWKLGDAAGVWNLLSTPVEIFSQTGALPTSATGSKLMSEVTGWNDKYKVAVMHIEMHGIVPGSNPADYHARFKVSGVNRSHILIVPHFGSQASAEQFLVPIPDNKTVSYSLEIEMGTPGNGNTFSAKLFVDGFAS